MGSGVGAAFGWVGVGRGWFGLGWVGTRLCDRVCSVYKQTITYVAFKNEPLE